MKDESSRMVDKGDAFMDSVSLAGNGVLHFNWLLEIILESFESNKMSLQPVWDIKPVSNPESVSFETDDVIIRLSWASNDVSLSFSCWISKATSSQIWHI